MSSKTVKPRGPARERARSGHAPLEESAEPAHPRTSARSSTPTASAPTTSGASRRDGLDVSTPAVAADRWEAVIRRLRTGTMPPGGSLRPDPEEYTEWLETETDRRAASAEPDPGTTLPIHRLNRLEYNNAINDLLGLDVDVRSLLPGDETADGSFDNFAA